MIVLGPASTNPYECSVMEDLKLVMESEILESQPRLIMSQVKPLCTKRMLLA